MVQKESKVDGDRLDRQDPLENLALLVRKEELDLRVKVELLVFLDLLEVLETEDLLVILAK